MTPEEKIMNFDEAIAAVRGQEPGEQQLQAAAARAWERIQQAYADPQFAAAAEAIRSCEQFRELLAERDAGVISPGHKLLLEDHLRECGACRRYSKGLSESDAEARQWTPAYQAARANLNWGRLGAYAALLIAAAIGGFAVNYYFLAPLPGAQAQVESVQGSLYAVSTNGDRAVANGAELQEGELLRTSAGSRAMVRLADGSRVEMNERAEFRVAANRRNTTIRLQRGSVIVQAAHRSYGHLYVTTPDCRVAVTGTVFSVNSGLKGSRVAVIEGNVNVGYGGHASMLHAGDEATTSSELGQVPIQQEISWSGDREHYLALLAELTTLRQKLEQIPLPAPGHESALLEHVPLNTRVYISIPNLGEALAEANQVFQAQLQQSPVLQQWWAKIETQEHGPKPGEIIEKVRQFSQYLGDEIVFAVARQPNGEAGGVALAQVAKPGLADFLRQQAPDAATAVYDEQSLSKAPARRDGPVFLVRNDLVVVATDLAALRAMDQQLNAGPSGFGQSAFAQRIKSAYQRGAGMLFAADLKSIVNGDFSGHTARAASDSFDRSGLRDVDYLIVERRDFSGPVADNTATLAFTGERRGVASWLAAPAPIGSLDFISSQASAAMAMLVKSPAQMLNDVLAAQQERGENPPQVVNDLAAAFGGDYALALDGPVLPQPAWRFVAEVNDPQRAQYAIEQVLQEAARQQGKGPAPTLQSSVESGRTFYTIKAHGQEFDYTYAEGYLVAAPSIALVMKSLQVHQSGDSLARSAGLRALLPQGARLDYSAVAYQNLAPVIQPLAGHVSGTELQSLETIAAGSKPSAVVAYGDPDRIEVETTSKFFGLDLNTLALGALLGNNPLTGRPAGTSR